MSEKKFASHKDSRELARQKRAQVRSNFTGKNGLYLCNDSSEFIDKYIDPELKRMFGKKTLNQVGSIDVERTARFQPVNSVFTDISINVERDLKQSIPFSATVAIAESKQLTDEEMLVQWPLLEAIGLADDMKDQETHELGYRLGVDGEDALELLSEDELALMQFESDIMEEMDYSEEDITCSLFNDNVYLTVRKALYVVRRKRPKLTIQTSYQYDGEEYYVQYGAWATPSTELVGDTLQQISLFTQASEEAQYVVEHEDATEFIEALNRLGFRS
jgi:frataxin-like iron-binding protein CyaY